MHGEPQVENCKGTETENKWEAEEGLSNLLLSSSKFRVDVTKHVLSEFYEARNCLMLAELTEEF